MSRVLLISVRLHEGRYHGVGDNPPSPARLFQALVAAAGIGGPLSDEEKRSLQWLERLPPPLVASPAIKAGQQFKNYMPNNDLDAVGGDRRRIGEIRVGKDIRPLLFAAEVPFLYAWPFGATEHWQSHAAMIRSLAERLYQFGRGWDMAWAWGEELTEAEFEERLQDFPGAVYRPSKGGAGKSLRCPAPGMLNSLMRRYSANTERFQAQKSGRNFSQQPKAQFRQVAYDSPPTRLLYEFHEHDSAATFAPWPLDRATELVETLRDKAKLRLQEALPEKSQDVERVLVGRKSNGHDAGLTSMRVRIVPLPSIGHHHPDRGIRRVLVEVPAGCPLRADDVNWAFAGQELDRPVHGRSIDVTPTEARDMLKHYGVDERHRVWRSVTPVALPESASRRRIDPARAAEQTKGGAERRAEQERVAAAVFHALRHAQVRRRPEDIRVQREPFESNGQRVEAFANGTRFPKERLWQVEIGFNEPVKGPLVIGDGRFLGLGIMAPVRRAQGIYAFAVEGGFNHEAQPNEAARALRRAVMARVQQEVGRDRRIAPFFTGHNSDGSIAHSETRPHLTFIVDPVQKRLLVIAPHVIAQRPPTREEGEHLATLDVAMTGFRELRAGPVGRLALSATPVDTDADRLFTRSRIWVSVTPYQATRHEKGMGASEALIADVRAECKRRGLSIPRVTPLEIRGVSKVGLVARVKLEFNVAVDGPITLGRSRHLGGGLFEALSV